MPGFEHATDGDSVSMKAAVPKGSRKNQRLLEMTAIHKDFGGVQALRGASFWAARGEIVGLCGENGAGKSTLLKVLSGVHPHKSYRGTIRLAQKELRLRSVADAAQAGITIVHQELMLVPQLTVAENLALGREPTHLGMIDHAALEQNALEIVRRFGVDADLDVNRLVGELGIGRQQMVEIMRALAQKARVLVLDEPTAALAKNETERLMAWLRSLKKEGCTIIYVSHRLDEVFALCDRVAVLRDGRSVGEVHGPDFDADELVRMMVGRKISIARRATVARPSAAPPALELKNFGVDEGYSPVRAAVRDISLRVQHGQIVALCGAMGSGRTALLSGLFGCARGKTHGQVYVGGKMVKLTSAKQAIAAGLALVPEDRKRCGLVMGMNVAQNLSLPWLASTTLMGRKARFGLVDPQAETLLAQRRATELHIHGDLDAEARALSGGNQQKVVLGKWLEQPPAVLLLDEPTRGVDVGAREEIYRILRRLAEAGTAILFASSDFSEILQLAESIVVLRHGLMIDQIPGGEADQALLSGLTSAAIPARLTNTP